MPAKIEPKGKRMTPDQFKAALVDLGIPHGKLGEVWGVSRELISRWCNGKVPIPGWVRYALAGVPVIRGQLAEPVMATKAMAIERVEKMLASAKPAQPAKALEPTVKGVWRFNKFYPDE